MSSPTEAPGAEIHVIKDRTRLDEEGADEVMMAGGEIFLEPSIGQGHQEHVERRRVRRLRVILERR